MTFPVKMWFDRRLQSHCWHNPVVFAQEWPMFTTNPDNSHQSWDTFLSGHRASCQSALTHSQTGFCTCVSGRRIISALVHFWWSPWTTCIMSSPSYHGWCFQLRPGICYLMKQQLGTLTPAYKMYVCDQIAVDCSFLPTNKNVKNPKMQKCCA